MKIGQVFSKVGNILKYLRRRREKRLYQQWVERAELPPEAIPQEKVAEEIIPKIDKNRPPLNILYILLGVSIVFLGTGLILLIIQSC